MQEARLDECVTLREKSNDVDSASSELFALPITRIGHVHMKRHDYAKAIKQFELSLPKNLFWCIRSFERSCLIIIIYYLYMYNTKL